MLSCCPKLTSLSIGGIAFQDFEATSSSITHHSVDLPSLQTLEVDYGPYIPTILEALAVPGEARIKMCGSGPSNSSRFWEAVGRWTTSASGRWTCPNTITMKESWESYTVSIGEGHILLSHAAISVEKLLTFLSWIDVEKRAITTSLRVEYALASRLVLGREHLARLDGLFPNIKTLELSTSNIAQAYAIFNALSSSKTQETSPNKKWLFSALEHLTIGGLIYTNKFSPFASARFAAFEVSQTIDRTTFALRRADIGSNTLLQPIPVIHR